MKYLKRFENIDDNSEIISDLRDILRDLEDEYFDVILGNKKFFVDRNRKYNYYILVGFLKDTTGGLAQEFKLSEIKFHFERVLKYMSSNGFEIEEVGSFNLSKSLDIPKDPEKWNLDMKVLGINFYFKNNI